MVYRRKRRIRGIRRKRGSRGTWFPIEGVSWLGGEGDDYYDASISDALDEVPGQKNQGPSLAVHPVTQDYTQQPALSAGESVNTRPTLRDFTEGQDYLLKSLVGNLTCVIKSNQGSETFNPGNFWTHVQVAAGFFVARAQDNDQSLPDLSLDEVDPLAQKNIQNSWIWRRSWILDNPANGFVYGSSNENGDPFTVFSYNVPENRFFAQEQSPHFQTKSRRRIKREERLWFVISSIGWDGQRGSVSATTNQPFVAFNLDVRLFGKMMRGRASSTF